MSKPMLMATMMDSDRNAWSLRICPNGAIVLVYLGGQIGELDSSEGTAILNQRTDAGERLEAVLATLEAIAGTIDVAARSHFMSHASWIDAHWSVHD